MMGGLIAAWLDIRSKPFRTIAAVSGMIAAVVAVVLVDAAGLLSQKANEEYLARQYGLPITVSVAATDPANTQNLEDMLDANGFDVESRIGSAEIQVLQDQHFRRVSIQFVSTPYKDIRIVDLVAGSWPQSTARSSVGHVVITEQEAMNLGYRNPQQAIGQVIPFTPSSGIDIDPRTEQLYPLIIDGVASTNTNAFGDAGILLVSDLPAPFWLPNTSSALVRMNPADFAMFQGLMSATNISTGDPLYSWSRIDLSEELAPVLDQQSVTSRAVQIVALVVGGLGIYGVGLASVRERSREFGLRRALGASTDMVFASVLMQSVLEALLAAACAIPLAAILLELFARQLVLAELPLPAQIELPLESVSIGIISALGVGVVAGLSPAVVAARASVAQSLRA